MFKHKFPPFFLLIFLAYSVNPLITPASGLGIGPPSFELDVPINGSNSTVIYVTSDGLSGELIVGTENLPFSFEPSRINISRNDVNMPVELIFYGNETLEPGVYEGKVTFLAMMGGFVAMGIKVRVNINLIGLETPAIPTFAYIVGTGVITGVIAVAVILVVKRYKNRSDRVFEETSNPANLQK